MPDDSMCSRLGTSHLMPILAPWSRELCPQCGRDDLDQRDARNHLPKKRA